jgi:hypothetical protein
VFALQSSGKGQGSFQNREADMTKNKGGRPRKELSDEDFDRLIGMVKIQCTQDEICNIFGMTAETLNTRLQERGEESFSTLYKKHQDEGRQSLRRAQWSAAMDGNPTMLVWLGKQMLGQRDKQDIAQTSRIDLSFDRDESEL